MSKTNHFAKTPMELRLTDDLTKCMAALADEHDYRMRVQRELKLHKEENKMLRDKLCIHLDCGRYCTRGECKSD